MDRKDYPALYAAADESSVEAQRWALGLIILYSSLLIAVSVLNSANAVSSIFAITSAILIVISIVVSIVMMREGSHDTWYRARALSESVKTISWRFMMRARPFDQDNVEEARQLCSDRIRAVLGEHRELAHEFGGRATGNLQVTPFMQEMRAKLLDDRKSFYLDCRVNDQHEWCRQKASV